MSETPVLSVILVTPTGLAQLRRTLTSIAAQTIAECIELVIVAPEAKIAEDAGRLLTPFCSHRVIAVGPIANVDHAVAHGLLAAAAPIVASIEDHAFPEPDWAERLLEVWDEDCVAVGSAIVNANPSGRLSWSNILIAYGQWSEATPEGDISWVALHNCSYRRAALEPFGEELSELVGRESSVLVQLRDAGGRFRFAPKARIRHLNPSRLASTARLRMDAGRLFAANRARDERWSGARCAIVALLGPLIPFVRYARMRNELFGPGRGLSEARHGFSL